MQTPAPIPDFDASTYVDQMSALLGLDIPADIRLSVIDNFERVIAIAQPVIEFALPDDLESASTFQP